MDYDIQRIKDLATQLIAIVCDLEAELELEVPYIDAEEPEEPKKK